MLRALGVLTLAVLLSGCAASAYHTTLYSRSGQTWTCEEPTAPSSVIDLFFVSADAARYNRCLERAKDAGYEKRSN